MLKVNEDVVSNCKLIFSFNWYNMCVGLEHNVAETIFPTNTPHVL